MAGESSPQKAGRWPKARATPCRDPDNQAMDRARARRLTRVHSVNP